jgi:hypothetical protein
MTYNLDIVELRDRRFGDIFKRFARGVEHRAGRDRLDKVGTLVEKISRLCRRFVGRRGDAEPHVGW